MEERGDHKSQMEVHAQSSLNNQTKENWKPRITGGRRAECSEYLTLGGGGGGGGWGGGGWVGISGKSPKKAGKWLTAADRSYYNQKKTEGRGG